MAALILLACWRSGAATGAQRERARLYRIARSDRPLVDARRLRGRRCWRRWCASRASPRSRPASGIAAFGAVVVLTMLASMSFDPRLIWDATDRHAQQIEHRKTASHHEANDPHDRRRRAADPLPEPRRTRRRNWLPSLIWLIPDRRGAGRRRAGRAHPDGARPHDHARFKTAEGLEAGKTTVKYKDVEIGTRQSIRLADDRSHVRVTRAAARRRPSSFTAADTRFWVVRPRLDCGRLRPRHAALGRLHRHRRRQVGGDRGEFSGLEAPPIVTRDASGGSSCCAPTTSARSTSARRSTTGASRSASSRPTSSTTTAAASRCGSSSTRPTTSSSAPTRASGMRAASTCSSTRAASSCARSRWPPCCSAASPSRRPTTMPGPPAPENTAFALAERRRLRWAAGRPVADAAAVLQPVAARPVAGRAGGFPRRRHRRGQVDRRRVRPRRSASSGCRCWCRSTPTACAARAVNEPANRATRTTGAPAASWSSKGLRAQLRTATCSPGQLYVALDFFPKRRPAEDRRQPGPARAADGAQQPGRDAGAARRDREQAQQGALRGDRRRPAQALATLNRTLAAPSSWRAALNNDVSPQMAAAMKDVRKTLQRRLSRRASPRTRRCSRTCARRCRRSGARPASLRVLTDYLERHPESLIRGKPEDKKK